MPKVYRNQTALIVNLPLLSFTVTKSTLLLIVECHHLALPLEDSIIPITFKFSNWVIVIPTVKFWCTERETTNHFNDVGTPLTNLFLMKDMWTLLVWMTIDFKWEIHSSIQSLLFYLTPRETEHLTHDGSTFDLFQQTNRLTCQSSNSLCCNFKFRIFA